MNTTTTTTVAADDDDFVEVLDVPAATPAELAALAAEAGAMAEDAWRIHDEASGMAARLDGLDEDGDFALGALGDSRLAVCMASSAAHEAAERLDESTTRRNHSVAAGAFERVKEAERRLLAAMRRAAAAQPTTLYVCNAFSLAMLARDEQASTPRTPQPIDDPRALVALAEAQGARVVSAVGHANTAELVGQALGREVACERVSIRLGQGERALVAQYVGPRLPEGATTLPEGARFEWWLV